MKITTLRTTALDCPHSNICPSIHDLDVDPRSRYVISKVSTVDEHAVFADLLLPGELLGWMPAGFIPAGNVLLERTGGVVDPRLHPERQYVITSPLAWWEVGKRRTFRPLVGPDEQLGRVPARDLAVV